ncbi:MAG: TlpA family protein disulfide reductase [Lachnospiraceae bacterium]|nr:TlpA family protein disulfide reductase [Lachnospiraceae bacterium]
MKKYMVFLTVAALGISMMTGCGKTAEAPAPEQEQEDDLYLEEDEYDFEDEDFEEYPEEDADDEGDIDDAFAQKYKEQEDRAVGVWYTDGYDEENNWAGSYKIELTDDRKATCTGWRNKDTGTFAAHGDDGVLITFDHCETDGPGEGFKTVDGFKYTIELIPNGDDATIKIDAPDVISNLEDGTVHRKSDGSSTSDNDVKGKGSGAGASELCFSGKDVNGKSINTADIFAKNKVTVVNMWASWCGPCVGEIPELDEMDKELKKKGCGVVGFLMDGEDPDGLEDAQDTLDDIGVSYQNIICAESVGDAVGLEAYPTTFFVDSNGKILGDPIVGAQPDQYRKTVDKLLSNM